MNGKTDRLEAIVHISDNKKLENSEIVFKTTKGKSIKADLEHQSNHQRKYTLTLQGTFNYAEEEVIATIVPKDSLQKQQVISSFTLVHLEPKKIKLSLVPLDEKAKGRLDDIKKNIIDTYKTVGVEFDIQEKEVLDISSIVSGNTIDTEDKDFTSTYSKQQNAINALYPDKEELYVLFVTSKNSSKNLKGYFRLNGQFGYIFANADEKTPAHEVGHGVFKLEHPWTAYKTIEGKTNLLMDYSKGQILSHLDWKQINDPKLKIYAFQRQSEGEDRDNDGIDLLGNIIIKVKQNLDDQKKNHIVGILDSTKPYLRTGYSVYKIVDGKPNLQDETTYNASIENGKVVYKTSNGDIFPYGIETATSGKANAYLLADKCYFSTINIYWEKPDSTNTQDIINLIASKTKGIQGNNTALFNPDPSCDKYNIVESIKISEQKCDANTVNKEYDAIKPILEGNNIELIVSNINKVCTATLGRIDYDILLKNIYLILNNKNTFNNVNETSEIAILRLITAISHKDYPKFFQELEKDNAYLFQKLYSEIDDTSIFFWEGDNHTGLMNLLLKMYQKIDNKPQKDPISIVVKEGRIDSHFVKIENSSIKGTVQYAMPIQGLDIGKNFEAGLFSPVDFIVIKENEYSLDLKRIPAFYVYYLLNQRSTDAFFKYLSTYADVYSLAIGLSNLSKLKDIPKAYRTTKTIIAGTEITTSTADILLNYSDLCNENKEVCDDLRKLTFTLNVATLSADIYTTAEIQKLAKNLTESADKNKITLPKEIADELAKVSGKGVDDIHTLISKWENLSQEEVLRLYKSSSKTNIVSSSERIINQRIVLDELKSIGNNFVNPYSFTDEIVDIILKEDAIFVRAFSEYQTGRWMLSLEEFRKFNSVDDLVKKTALPLVNSEGKIIFPDKLALVKIPKGTKIRKSIARPQDWGGQGHLPGGAVQFEIRNFDWKTMENWFKPIGKIEDFIKK